MKRVSLLFIAVLMLAGCKKKDDAPLLSVAESPVTLSFGAAEESVSFEIKSNTGWTVSGHPAWLEVTPATGRGNKSVNVKASANTSAARTATLTVSAKGAAPVSVDVQQDAFEPPAAPVITITLHPADAAFTQGEVTGSLLAAATVTQDATPAYQWYSNTAAVNTGGAKIDGATEASYDIPATLAKGTYYYFCEISAAGAETVRTEAATVTVTVTDVNPAIAVTGVSLDKTSLTIFTGGSETLIATVSPADATNRNVVWESSNTARATVADGVVTIADGATVGQTAVITVRTEDGNYTAACTVTVVGAIASQFNEGGIYYKIISGTDVKVTNKLYTDNLSGGIEDSYKGAVNIPAAVTHDGVDYSVTAIGTYAFGYNNGLTSVTLGANVKTIDDRAFSGCSALGTLTLNGGLTSIGNYAFSGCSALGTLTLNEGLTSIGAQAFSNCSTLATLHIPSTVTVISIGNPVFAGCSNLTLTAAAGGLFSAIDGVLFEGGAGDNAGNPLYYLRWIPEKTGGAYIITEGVVEIRDHSIRLISGITSLTFPAGVTAMNTANNFGGLTSLATLTFKGAAPPSTPDGIGSLAGHVSKVTLHVPAGAKAAYLAHDVWGTWGSGGIVEDE